MEDSVHSSMSAFLKATTDQALATKQEQEDSDRALVMQLQLQLAQLRTELADDTAALEQMREELRRLEAEGELERARVKAQREQAERNAALERARHQAAVSLQAQIARLFPLAREGVTRAKAAKKGDAVAIAVLAAAAAGLSVAKVDPTKAKKK